VNHGPDLDADSPVLAAGAICWRPAPSGGLELLLVRSARWGDWSWPKGKLDPGETRPECAVREVAEETGARIELGVPLPSVSYVLPDGRDKSVSYWAGRVRATGPRTALDDEIADVEWLPVEAALERLSRPGDLAPVHELLDLDERGRLDTRPLLVLRHAKARSRARWSGGEADRPLTGSGRRQAQRLAGLLACWRPERVLCSPWARCMLTLRPYLDRLDELEQRPQPSMPEVLAPLSEDGLHHDPDRIAAIVAESLADHRSALLCTHRPVLEKVFAALSEAASAPVRSRLPARDPWLAPAEILVAHVRNSLSLSATDRLHTVERFRAESSRNAPH
jgi:8-oxo-dGTP pyrophosphatase MutT (NUDIX family)/phosphohistidine phosphatase SixA